MNFARIRQEASSHVDVMRVVAVAVAYYVASLVGLSLRLPPAITSVLWPPNAILTAALLLTPRRHWGSVLLGGLFAHLAAQLRTDWPLPLVILLFGTNCAEALIAAVGLRRLSDDPRCFDTLKRFAAFIAAAVIAAPLLSTLADAAVVSWLRGDSVLGGLP